MNIKTVAINKIGQLAIGVWAIAMVFVVACLMVSHWVALPHPSANDQAWGEQLIRTRSIQAEQWTVFHFLYGSCPCSRRVLDHIVNRDPVKGCRERIVLIGEDSKMTEAALQRGFEVDCVTPEILQSRYGIEAAPMLSILDSSGTVRYAGGYTTHKQGPQIQDVKIIQELLDGAIVEDLPLFGCAVSDKLKSLIDPLGLKK